MIERLLLFVKNFSIRNNFYYCKFLSNVYYYSLLFSTVYYEYGAVNDWPILIWMPESLSTKLDYYKYWKEYRQCKFFPYYTNLQEMYSYKLLSNKHNNSLIFAIMDFRTNRTRNWLDCRSVVLLQLARPLQDCESHLLQPNQRTSSIPPPHQIF